MYWPTTSLALHGGSIERGLVDVEHHAVGREDADERAQAVHDVAHAPLPAGRSQAVAIR
jgi:hypothetical protein